jgi:hypothetical protein
MPKTASLKDLTFEQIDVLWVALNIFKKTKVCKQMAATHGMTQADIAMLEHRVFSLRHEAL